MKNAVSGRTKTDLSALYDELEGKLRSLESLGRTQKKYGDFLTPLVESCLPKEILMAWERKRNTETDAKGSRTLEHLMTFLRLEVQGEEMVQLAKSGFGTPIRKRDSPTERVKSTELTTASALASSEKSSELSEKKICGFISKIEDKRILNELKNKEIILSDLNCKETEIGLLIGADNIGKLLTGNLIEFDSGLTAIETKLGWTVIGKNKMKILPDGRYEVKLPWKCNSENLPSNKELTWKRHLRMMNKLRNGKFFEDYKSVFRQWEDLNIIERVPEVELNNECHYLPHRPVIKLDSATTKIRPVLDVSAREKGKRSLNDCLYKGVNLIELIPDILDRFRIYPVGIVADIEKAFLMLSVAPKDRDYLRYFFPCNEKQLVYRHCRVVFGESSSPYLLNASIMHLLENCNSECKEVALKLKSSFYVDNCVTGVFSADEIEIFIEKTKLIMSEGCFNLRIFESNVASKSVDKHSGETFILGIIWDLDNDVLKCCTNFDSLTCEVKITKRLVLSTVQKVFYPIGMLAPSTLLPKFLLQEIWKMKKAWDQELPQNIVNKFMKWFNEIQVLKDVTVPRCMKIDIFTELHVCGKFPHEH
ncbi:integrase catalytic domain-containing protein [Trichonephila clavipes]|nr:integrase catalytic domain-containing protein [Trichonephila clavipes]